MKKIRNFKCSQCHSRFERMVIDAVTIVKCDCSGEALRMLSAPKVFGNTTGRSPSFSNKRF